MTTKKKPARPFVIIMRHDSGADPHVAVRATWEDALSRAGKFWEGYDHVFRAKSKRIGSMFLPGEGYDQRVEIIGSRREQHLFVSHAGSDGPRFTIERAED